MLVRSLVARTPGTNRIGDPNKINFMSRGNIDKKIVVLDIKYYFVNLIVATTSHKWCQSENNSLHIGCWLTGSLLHLVTCNYSNKVASEIGLHHEEDIYFVDSILGCFILFYQQSNFPSPILRPGEVYQQFTVYKFGVKP